MMKENLTSSATKINFRKLFIFAEGYLLKKYGIEIKKKKLIFTFRQIWIMEQLEEKL